MKHSVTEHQLLSGARGIVVDVPGSSVINLEVRFNSGFSFADRATYELPHVLEHMLATVSERYPAPNAFMVEVSKNGAYMNASTGVRANSYIYEFAPFELDRILDLVEEQLVRPHLVADRLAGELSNVREELTRNTTQPGAMVAIAILAAAQPSQWLDYDARIAQLDGIRVDKLTEYYRRTHTAANAYFSVAGDVGQAGAIVDRLERMFQQLPGGQRLLWQAERGRKLAEPVVKTLPIGQIYYRFSRSLPELTMDQRRALAVLRTLLVGGLGSRILGKAREKGWAYGIGGAFAVEPGAASVGFGGYVMRDHAENLFALIGEQMQLVANSLVSTDELTDAVHLMTGNWLRAMQTPADVLSWYSEDYDEWGIVRTFDDEVAAIRNVQPEAVSAVAKLVLQYGRFAAAFAGDLNESDAHNFVSKLGQFGPYDNID